MGIRTAAGLRPRPDSEIGRAPNHSLAEQLTYTTCKHGWGRTGQVRKVFLVLRTSRFGLVTDARVLKIREHLPDNMRTGKFKIFTLLSLSLSGALALATDDLKPIALPAPQFHSGKPLMQTLRERRTTREFKTDKLKPDLLANLLWAAFGINRPTTGQRTAPSAMNSQELDIYVALPEGLFLYDAKVQALTPVLARDLRATTGGQDSIKAAPVTLIFVADLARLSKATPASRPLYANFDAGCICQNVYLFCASEGLATVVHDLDRAPLAQAMNLKPEQQIIFVQAVGFPKDAAALETKR